MDEIKISLLDQDRLKELLVPVTTSQVFEASSDSFHPEGLFSTQIFGQPGTDTRVRKASYIDLKTDILRPNVFKMLVTSRALYEDIMRGTTYAVFSAKEKDFIQDNSDKAQTGFHFFTSNLHRLLLPDTESTKRTYVKKILKKNKSTLLIDAYTVIPAGIRDYSVDENGVGKKDAINDLYLKLLNLTSTIHNTKVVDPSIDQVAYSIQVTIVELYEYIANLLLGKHKVFNKKFLKRRVYGSSLQVLTSNVNRIKTKGDASLGINDSYIGLQQYMAGILPVIPNRMGESSLSENLQDKLSDMYLINAKTNSRELVDPDPDLVDLFMTEEGVSTLIKMISSSDVTENDPYIHRFNNKEYHLLLVYHSKEGACLVADPSLIPEDKLEYLKPVSLSLMIYLILTEYEDQHRGVSTRYPAIEEGSSIPVGPILKLRQKFLKVNQLDPLTLEPTGKVYERYPDEESGYFTSISLSHARWDGLSADADGDKLTHHISLTSESRKEIDGVHKNFKYYKSTTPGQMLGAPSTVGSTSLVVDHMVA